MKCTLRWSRWELCFVSICHLAALVSLFRAELLLWLELFTVTAVCGSFLQYLHDRIRTYCSHTDGVWRAAAVEIVIGTQSARLSTQSKSLELHLPRVIYLSEHLMVLSFLPESGEGPGRDIRLALWPDSLAAVEARRLRRYLRFDLPANLSRN